ncbi:MAG: ribosome-binding factor A [Leptospiraceae bacterium]|nr:ribosome-binding factor A [Leptospiraceae bacterium]
MNDIQKLRQEKNIVRLISEIFIKEFAPEYDVFVTFVDCKLSNDGSEARLGVSLYGDEEQGKKAWERLTRASGYFAGRIARKLRLRATPRFLFHRVEITDYSAAD